MASESGTQQRDGPVAASANTLSVNLQVVSPSVGVNRPLLFPGLPASTTIKQLKEKIRQSLPMRPADETQRLIHRGRAIVRETDTLLDIFGDETLRNPDQQTIHLVIREAIPETHATGATTNARDRSASPATQMPNAQRQHVPQPTSAFGPQPPPGFARRNAPQSNTPLAMPRGPSPARAPVAEQPQGPQAVPSVQHALAHQQALLYQQHYQQAAQAAQQHHHQHQTMTQWLTQLQREAMARTLINQNQRQRAQMGMRGIGDPAASGGTTPAESQNGRASPAPGHHTVVRESIGPNGRTYQVETVIRGSTPTPQQGLSPVDVQNIIRGADVNQATATITSAMHRSASNASLHSRPLTQPGVTTPISAAVRSTSRPPSGRATPDAGYRFATGGYHTPAQTSAPAPPRQGLEVYMLSSPEGPRALVINNHTSETFYTPMVRSQPLRTFTDFGSLPTETQPQQGVAPQPTPTVAPEPQPQDQGRQAGQIQQQAPLPDGANFLHPHNPPAGALPPLLVGLMPHLVMLLRLGVMMWLFTTPNLSWFKWLSMVLVAILMFVHNTGVLNGMGDHVWRPLGRQMEHLIPPLERPARRPDAVGEGRDGVDGDQQNRDPNPADMAARLIAEQRGRQPWLTEQFRRLERAGLLFLASIAPGLAEEHIANIEREARAERQRQEAEEAAAREAAEAEANNEANEGETRPGENGTDASLVVQGQEQTSSNSREQTGAEEPGARGDEPVPEPLIAM